MTKRITWKDVEEALMEPLEKGLYISYDDWTGRKVLRCNNGWIQARTPRNAMIFINGIIG